MELLTLLVTVVITFAFIAATVYIICRIATPFVKELIYTAKEKEHNAIVEEALQGQIQYYERMIEATQNESLKEEYQDKIRELQCELDK